MNIQIEQIRDDLTWRIRHEAMYPDSPLDIVKLEDDKDGIHFGLFADDQLTSVVSLFEAANVYQFRKFATIPNAQGKGLGTALLNHIIVYVKSMGGEKLWCNARMNAAPFYSKFGFENTDNHFNKHNIDFVVMELKIERSN